MRKEIEINGCIEIPEQTTIDEFYDIFISFVESKGWYFGGGFNEIVDGVYVSPDGSKGTSDMSKKEFLSRVQLSIKNKDM